MVFSIDIVIALVVSLLVAIAVNKSTWPVVLPVLKKSLTLRLFFMVFGILLFKDMLDLSGAVSAIPEEVNRLGIPPALVIFTVAFLSGLLTGMVAAFVGLSFPLLAGFLYQPDLHLGNIFFTYLSGYLGMILSPTHFCLLLTSEHFHAELGEVYKTFALPLLLLSLVGVSLYLSGYPWHLLR
jgi:integral membrane protein (TIGR00529 family)